MDDQIVFETLMHISKSLAILDVCVICSQIAFALSAASFIFIVVRDALRNREQKIRNASHIGK